MSKPQPDEWTGEKPRELPAWLLAASPLFEIGIRSTGQFPNRAMPILLGCGVYVALFIFDNAVREKVGDKPRSIGSIIGASLVAPLAVPLYLFQRSRKFKQSYGPCVLFLVILGFLISGELLRT